MAALKARATAEITNLPILYHRFERKSMVFEGEIAAAAKSRREHSQARPSARSIVHIITALGC
jgi:hypothetical protein